MYVAGTQFANNNRRMARHENLWYRGRLLTFVLVFIVVQRRTAKVFQDASNPMRFKTMLYLVN